MKKNSYLYLGTLSIIFILILSIIGLIHIAVQNQESDAKIINISGRQRMLSQKIIKCILLTRSEKSNEENIIQLQTILSSFKKAHYGLQFGDDSLQLPPCEIEHILDLFQLIEPEYNGLVSAASLILENPNDSLVLAKAEIKALSHEGIFLRTMDLIVNAFEKEAKDKISQIEKIEFTLAVSALLVVACIWFFILKPLHNKSKKAYKELSEVNKSLNDSVIQLEEMTQTLSEEVEERNATEEKLFKNQAKLADTNEKLNLSLVDLKKLTVELEDEIEERKSTELKLKRNQEELEKMALIANKTDNAVVICNELGKIEWVNASFERITEYTLNEVIGQKPGEVLQGKDTNLETVSFMSEKLKKGQGFTTDVINYTKSGKQYWIRLEVQPIRNMNGEVIKFIAIESDISQKKENEEMLKIAKDKAEKAAQVKQEFLSTISHEIRTPMNAVVGLTQLLLNTNPKSSQMENLKALKFSANTLLALINDILDLSKIESGKIAFEKTEIVFKDIFQGLEKSLGVIADKKDISLSCTLSEKIPHVLIGDQTRLNQVLTNLINNAIKFTEEGGVTVKAEVEQISEKAVQLLFTVTDTGIGIPEDKLEVIFERFSQAQSNTTRLYGGTGLGLSISRQLIELQGGEISVESKVGSGTTFSFSLSFELSDHNVEANNPSLISTEKHTIEDLHVLLVDDHEMNQLVAQQFLENWGATMDIAESGEEALEKIINKTYHIVLMDLNMPGIDGFDTSNRIRSMQDSYFKQIPIIALTATAIDEVKHQVYESGMNDFVSKPFNPDELFNKLIKHSGVKEWDNV
ncbi:MAG: ATP-binding protein [Bacteroidota bacterium]